MNQISNTNELLATPGLGRDLCVEFFGLPGSGKTTIAQAVHAILSRGNPELIFAPRLLRDEAGAAVRAATKLRLILSEFVRSGTWSDAVGRTIAIRQPRLRDSLRAVLTIATVGSLNANLRRRRLGAVLDQGALQALWSVQLCAPHDEYFDALVAGVLDDAVLSRRLHVAVETPQKVCIERLETRISKHSRMQNAGTAKDLHVWENAELLRQAILGDLRAAYQRQSIPDRIFTVDGTADPVATARQIAAAVLQMGPAGGLQRSTPVQRLTA